MESRTSKPSQTLQWLIWGVLLAAIAGIFVMSLISRSGKASGLPVISQIPDFTLTNQDNRVFTQADLKGKVWISDIIFTRCGGPCPEMTRKMIELQKEIPAKLPVHSLILTTDPDFDTPSVLSRYGERFGADLDRSAFLTGEKKEIYKVAVGGLKLSAFEENPDPKTIEDLFIHATYFVLVDKWGRMRAVFQSTDPDVNWSEEKAKILAAAAALAKEKKP